MQNRKPQQDEPLLLQRRMPRDSFLRSGVYVLAGLSLLLGVLCYIFLLCAAGALVFAFIGSWILHPAIKTIYAKEGFVIVALTWVLVSARRHWGWSRHFTKATHRGIYSAGQPAMTALTATLRKAKTPFLLPTSTSMSSVTAKTETT